MYHCCIVTVLIKSLQTYCYPIQVRWSHDTTAIQSIASNYTHRLVSASTERAGSHGSADLSTYSIENPTTPRMYRKCIKCVSKKATRYCIESRIEKITICSRYMHDTVRYGHGEYPPRYMGKWFHLNHFSAKNRPKTSEAPPPLAATLWPVPLTVFRVQFQHLLRTRTGTVGPTWPMWAKSGLKQR